MPPWKVEVAVVVATKLPTDTCDEVASTEVPLNHKRALESLVAFVPPLAIESVPAVTSPAADAKSAPERPTILRPFECIWTPRKVEVLVSAPMFVVSMPPANVEVAVVVATKFPTVTCEDVACIDVPLNQSKDEESADAFVPPLAMGRTPVTSLARLISAVETAPAVALRKPEMELMVRPPPVMLSPPAIVEVAVPVALILFVWRWRTWRPPANVEVDVVEAVSIFSKSAVDEAMSEYAEPVNLSAVEVAEYAWPYSVPWVKASYDVRPVASVPQTTSPAALVSTSAQPRMDEILSPPDWSWMPENVEVAVAPMFEVAMPPANVEVAVVVATREPTVTWEEMAR